MSLIFSSPDFSAFVFGREVLKVEKQAAINFEIGSVKSSEEDFWKPGLDKILSEITRFGRIGLMYERKNTAAKKFIDEIGEQDVEYTPQEPKRAEEAPFVYGIQTRVLREMANEGLADTVEFRRLARKYIRNAKNANCDTLFFLDAIMGEETTRKILQHLAGKRMKVVVPSDFLQISTPKTGDLQIKTSEDLHFTHHRAEEILRRKIKKSDLSA